MNKVIHGESLSEMKKFGDEFFDAIITDPPYGIGFKYKEKEKADDPSSYWDWFKPYYIEMMRILKPGGFYAIFQAYKYFPYYWKWYGNDIDIFISAKNFSTLYKKSINLGYDPAVIGFKQGAEPNLPENRKSRNFVLCNTASNKQGVKIKSKGQNHPSPKPIDGLKYLIRNFTNIHDIILDPFAGSGQVLIAAQQSQRNFIGIEMEKDYYDFISTRLRQNQTFFEDFQTPV